MEKEKKNAINENIEKKVIISDDSKISPLEKKAHFDKKRDEVKEVIEELISELEPNRIYEKIEKKLKEKELDEKEAIELGFKPDNYYSAKEKEDEENDLERNIEGSTGSMSGMQRTR